MDEWVDGSMNPWMEGRIHGGMDTQGEFAFCHKLWQTQLNVRVELPQEDRVAQNEAVWLLQGCVTSTRWSSLPLDAKVGSNGQEEPYPGWEQQ